jgi:CDP-diacylglycerol pyrophosphatase
MWDMSEFDSRKAKREAWQAREFVAKFYAMPLRTITGVYTRNSGKAAILDCGHIGVLYLWLRVGESMRCRDCYEGGLREAERMIERIGG